MVKMLQAMGFNFENQIRGKTDKELIDIFTNPHLYQPLFVEQTKAEILRRNISIEPLEKIQEQNLTINSESFSEGRQGNEGYMILIGISAIFGGIIAIVGGYVYAFSTHVDSTGKKHFVYNKATRKWGQIIFGVGVTVFLLMSLYKLYSAL